MLMKMSANYVCGFVTFTAGTRPAVFCLTSRSVVGLEVLCTITTMISDLALSLLTMNCQPVTFVRPQNLVETNTPTPSSSLTHRGLNVWR